MHIIYILRFIILYIMWLILGFKETSYEGPPEPFFVGIFQEQSIAVETCKRMNEETKDDTMFEVKQIELNKVYDYEWTIMGEEEYK